MTNKKVNIGAGTIGLLIAVLFASSCSDYLSTNSDSTVSQSTAFSSVSYTGSAITGIYAALAGDNGFGERMSTIIPMATDAFETSGNYDCNDRRGISMYKPCPSNPELDEPFSQIYEGINRANIAIKYIPQSDIFKDSTNADHAQMQSYYGQALALRAQFYYELIKNWGDVPAPFKPSADIGNLYMEKTNRDSIYDKIIADLKTAEQDLPWRSESGAPPTRLTKGAVKGLRARIALASGGYSLRRDSQQMELRENYEKYYQIAYEECKDLLNKRGEHDLDSSFEQVFRYLQNSGSDPNHELMFIVGAFGGHNKADSKIGYYNGLEHDQSSKWPGGGGVHAIPTYFYEFNKYDLRRNVTVAPFEINKNNKKIVTRSSYMTDGKFRKSWAGITGPIQYTETKWPILRFSDVLLMFAEADNEIHNGPSQQAIDAFNEVRKRAFSNSHQSQLDPVPTDYQGFFEAIVHQRLLEFGGEGIRKYDLIRWNLLGEKLNETRNKLNQFMNGTGEYANVPEVIYSKPANYDPSNNAQVEVNTLDVFGRDSTNVFTYPTPAQDPPSGYISVRWRTGITQSDINGDQGGYARYFQENHSELLPIYEEVVNQNYNLTQDYGY